MDCKDIDLIISEVNSIFNEHIARIKDLEGHGRTRNEVSYMISELKYTAEDVIKFLKK